MEQNMMDPILEAKSMEKEHLDGQTMQHFKETFSIIISMVWALTIGLTAESIQGTGKITKWMEKEYLSGQMAEDMKVPIKMTRNLARVFLNGKILQTQFVLNCLINHLF
jgi:hypothetical protein